MQQRVRSRARRGVRRVQSFDHGPDFWVVHCRGQFAVRQEGVANRLTPPVTQRRAIAIARMLARANHSELIVQGEHGHIRSRDSHGFDPSPPRG